LNNLEAITNSIVKHICLNQYISSNNIGEGTCPRLGKSNYERLKTWRSVWQQMFSTFAFSQSSGTENHFSSTTTPGDKGFSVNTTAAIDDVKTTLFTEEAFLQEARTFSVPFTAGSINST
jgi:hypothetical protein